ncbi:unnamed protein product [Cyprideis torosa]|uniref:small monomeric GTPase n=1 Tax=Cyprideis torosa TaxID=163714 RepID=A0A7R8W741_9CRUS|nr:unnamed protein product [Cyprideis torosa]CAG0884759.1 unnamed protein product [Cyprideis torosa]
MYGENQFHRRPDEIFSVGLPMATTSRKLKIPGPKQNHLKKGFYWLTGSGCCSSNSVTIYAVRMLHTVDESNQNSRIRDPRRAASALPPSSAANPPCRPGRKCLPPRNHGLRQFPEPSRLFTFPELSLLVLSCGAAKLLMGNPEISSGFTNGKMTSNAIRGIRRKKSTLSEVRIAVIGAPGVGKSALTVRFLTKRYIGEYDHQADSKHKHEMLVDGEPVIFEIMDTTAKNPGELPPSELLQWADGFFLVFSITDRDSFTYIKRVKQQILDRKGGKDVNNSFSGPPMAIVGNKGDMVHLRQVSTEEEGLGQGRKKEIV